MENNECIPSKDCVDTHDGLNVCVTNGKFNGCNAQKITDKTVDEFNRYLPEMDVEEARALLLENIKSKKKRISELFKTIELLWSNSLLNEDKIDKLTEFEYLIDQYLYNKIKQ